MAASLNKVMLIGRVGKDPEVRHLASGAVANLSVATDESYKKDGQKIEATEWHRIQVWGRLAEIVEQYVGKGRLVYVEGKIKTRKWEDQSGQTRYATEIVASSLTLLDKGGQTAPANESDPEGYIPGNDDVPF